MATVLGITLLPYLPRRYRYIVPLWILAVAVSRIYLGVHAPLDTIGGFGLGLFVACFLHNCVEKRTLHKRKNHKKESYDQT